MNAAIPAGLIGSWKLISVHYTLSDTGETIDEPLAGTCSFDANGRWTLIVIPRDADPPTNETERAALFGRIIAFSGRCRFDGERLETRPDVASNPAFKEITFVRSVTVDGDRLTMVQPEWEHPLFSGRKTVATAVWDRDG